MAVLKVFVGKSFHQGDASKVKPIEDFLESFRSMGLVWQTGEDPEAQAISNKVQERIDGSDVFLGILTRRYPIVPSRPGLRIALACLLRNFSAWSAPPWILEEIGYALKAGKRLILFREADLDLGGLEADLEYIPYDALNPNQALTKASHMLNSLMAEHSGVSVEVVASVRQVESPAEGRDAPVPTVLEGTKQSQDSLFAIWADTSDAIEQKNWELAKTLFKSGLQLIETDETSDPILWSALYHSYSFRHGRSESLSELEALQHKHPDRHEVLAAMAGCYKAFGEFGKAAVWYSRAAALASGAEQFNYRISLCESLAGAKDYEKASSELVSLLTQASGPTQREEVLWHLFSVWQKTGDFLQKTSEKLSFGVAELLLRENPAHSKVRFELAAAYGTAGWSRLELLHCKRLADNDPQDSPAVHNLAVAFGKNDMPIASVRSYQVGIGMGETLSASNLSYHFLDAGFAEEAMTLLERAATRPDCVPNVKKAIGEIERRKEVESERQEALLQEAEIQRNFMAEFGAASLAILKKEINGEWRFPFGPVELKLEGSILTGAARIQEISGGLGSLSRFLEPVEEAAKKYRQYRIDGRLFGRVCELEVTSYLEKPSFPSPFDSSNSTMLIYFSADGCSAKATELKNGIPNVFHDIERSTDPG